MRVFLTGLLLAVVLASGGQAGEIVFTESFTGGPANWATGGENLAGHQPTGGADGGGFIDSSPDAPITFAGSFASAFGSPANAVLFRANDDFNSSGGAFVGNWIDAGYTSFSFFVRHDSPLPVQFFARFASPNNQFGASVTNGQLVLPNQWTEVVLDVSRGSSDIISFGAAGGQPDPFAAVFSSIGNIQISAFRPFGLTDEQAQQPLLFALDEVSLAVPEPASVAMVALGSLAGLVAWGRQRIHR